jgi:hypothetical protein
MKIACQKFVVMLQPFTPQERALPYKVANEYSETYKKQVDPLINRQMTRINKFQEEHFDQLSPPQKKQLQDSIYISQTIEKVNTKTAGIFSQALKEFRESAAKGNIQSYEEINAIIERKTNELLTRKYSADFAEAYTSYTSTAKRLRTKANEKSEKILKENDNHEEVFQSYKEKIERFTDQYPEMKLSLLTQLYSFQRLKNSNPNKLESFVDLQSLITSFEQAEAFSNSPSFQGIRQNFVTNIQKTFASELPSDQKSLFQVTKERSKKTQFQNCKMDFEIQMNQLVSNEDTEKTRGSIEEAVKSYILNIVKSEMYSEETLIRLADYLRSLSIRTPPSREEYLDQLEIGISQAMEGIQKQSKLLAVGTSLLGQSGYQCGILPSQNIGNFYHHGASLSDSYIHLSNQALHNFDQVGRHVLNHELGHAVSFFLQYRRSSRESRRSQKNRLSCLGRGHLKGNFWQRLFKFSVPHFQEEDFADALTASLFPDLPNPGCALLVNGQPRTKDRNITTSPPSEDDPYQGYPHSSSVFRVLSMHKYQDKEIPKSCEEPLKKENFDIGYNGSCLGWEYDPEEEDW